MQIPIKNLITSVVTVLTTISREVNDNNDLKTLVCGEYADGRPRSISDAISGEYRSPKQRKKMEGGKNKKHKKDKYKKKYKKLKRKNKKHSKKQKKYSKKYKYTI